MFSSGTEKYLQILDVNIFVSISTYDYNDDDSDDDRKTFVFSSHFFLEECFVVVDVQHSTFNV